MGYNPWGGKELDMTEYASTACRKPVRGRQNTLGYHLELMVDAESR